MATPVTRFLTVSVLSCLHLCPNLRRQQQEAQTAKSWICSFLEIFSLFQVPVINYAKLLHLSLGWKTKLKTKLNLEFNVEFQKHSTRRAPRALWREEKRAAKWVPPKSRTELCCGCHQDRPAAENHLLAHIIESAAGSLCFSCHVNSGGHKTRHCSVQSESTFAILHLRTRCCVFEKLPMHPFFSRLERRACSPKSWRSLWRKTSECRLSAVNCRQ